MYMKLTTQKAVNGPILNPIEVLNNQLQNLLEKRSSGLLSRIEVLYLEVDIRRLRAGIQALRKVKSKSRPFGLSNIPFYNNL